MIDAIMNVIVIVAAVGAVLYFGFLFLYNRRHGKDWWK